jgi:amino acid permease
MKKTKNAAVIFLLCLLLAIVMSVVIAIVEHFAGADAVFVWGLISLPIVLIACVLTNPK